MNFKRHELYHIIICQYVSNMHSPDMKNVLKGVIHPFYENYVLLINHPDNQRSMRIEPEI